MTTKFTKLHIILAIVFVLSIAVSIGFWVKGNGKPNIKWKLVALERGPIHVTVTATGILQAIVTVQVGTQVSGTVSEIKVDFNSQIKKGQLLARIDTTLLMASLSDAISAQEKFSAQADQANEELKRTQSLFDRALVSQSEKDLTLANARVANANLKSAKAQVARAKINLHYATIISPIEGIVLSRAVDVGQTVAASFNTPTLFTIAGDLKKMQVLASIDEADIGKIAIGQKSSFTVDAYPDTTFSAEVKQIRLQPISLQNVVSYYVILEVQNPSLKLMPGMTANLTLTVGGKENVLFAPTAALQFKPPFKKPESKTDGKDKSSNLNREKLGESAFRSEKVFVVFNGQPKPIRVKTGVSDGMHTEIETMENQQWHRQDSGSSEVKTPDPKLEEGVMVITGIESATSTPKNQTSPFMPKAPPGAGGGGGRSR